MIASLALLAACVDDPADRAGWVEALPPGGAGQLVATTTDYSVGSLAVLDLETGRLGDDLAPTSGDPSVVATGGRAIQLNGFLNDFVRVYDPAEWGAPLAEFGTGQGSNPHGAALVGGALWLTLYGTASLEARDPEDGALRHTVDLSPWADADGLPEASSLLVVDGTLLVALERLDRGDGWLPGEGVVLAVDPADGAVLREWRTGPSPRLWPRPSAPGEAWLVTGSYRTVDGWSVPALDGEVRPLHVVDGPGAAVWVEAERGERVDAWTEGEDGGIIALLDPGDGTWRAICGDAEAPLDGPAGARWLADVAVAGDRAFLAARALVGGGALIALDRATCAAQAEVQTTLPPFSLAWVP